MAYTQNTKADGLDTLSSLANDDVVIVADTDDSSRAKTITKANLKTDIFASPALTGNPTAPTQSASDNSTKIATTAYVETAITASGSNTVSMTANEDLTIGNPVGVSNMINSTVARAVRVQPTAAHGVANQTFTGQQSFARSCPIGGDKFAYLLYSTDGSDTLYAQVGSVDTDTNTVTLGTAVSVIAAFKPVDTALVGATICKLDTDKFMVFYVTDAAPTAVQGVVCTVSGTTITVNTPATAATIATNITKVYCDQISTDKGILVLKSATATDGLMVAFTVSATTPSFGSGVAMGTNTDNNNVTGVKKISTDKYVVVCTDASNSVYAQVCTISGTVISAGTEAQISTVTSATTGDSVFSIVSPATDVFAVSYISTGTTVNFVVCTVSGTTPTAGTPLTISSMGSVGALIPVSASEVRFFGSTLLGAESLSISGTTISDAGAVLKGIGTYSPEQVVYMDNSYPVTFQIQSANIVYWVYGMSNNFIGFAQATVSAGESVNVIVRGVDQNQSNLVAGNIYQVSDGALSVVSATGVVDNLNEQFYVKAISSSKVIV